MKAYEIPEFWTKKIRGKFWPGDRYIYLSGDFWFYNFGTEYDHYEDLFREDDWEPYEGPKKKVKMWKWLLKRENRTYCSTESFYMSKEDAKESLGNTYEVIKKLDWSEIEVEE